MPVTDDRPAPSGPATEDVNNPTACPVGPPTAHGRAPLDLARLAAAPWPVQVVAAVASTNAELREAATLPGSERVLVTEHQTSGRGRLGRAWEAPPGAALTFSALVWPQVPDLRWTWLPLLTGVAVVEELQRRGADAVLKWPNDVLIGPARRKLAGILVERVGEPSGPAGAVVGLGLNVSTTREELPVAWATSLALEGIAVDRTDLLVGLIAGLAAEYAAWTESPDDFGLRDRYRAHCATLQVAAVTVSLPGGRTVTGRPLDVGAHGELIVDDAGTPLVVAAGDVVHVR